MFNRRIFVTKYILFQILIQQLISYFEKMCFINWQFRSFVQNIYMIALAEIMANLII